MEEREEIMGTINRVLQIDGKEVKAIDVLASASKEQLLTALSTLVERYES